MAIRTDQAPPRGTRKPGHSGAGPKPSPFQPRPFGETVPSPSAPLPDLQTQIDRAGRFGHNLACLSLPSACEAPIQRKGKRKAETPAERAKRLAREADKTKLRGMFNVTNEIDPLVGTTPHQVTEKEFDEIAELYSKIREGDSHVKIANQSMTVTNGTASFGNDSMSAQDFAAFKGKAMDDIAKVLQTPEGREVLKSLGAGGKNHSSEVTIGSTAPLDSGTDVLDKPNASNGTGSGSNVYYSAGTEITPPPGRGLPQITSDTALFHELVHAYHAGQGNRIPDDVKVDHTDTVAAGTSARDVGLKKLEYAATGFEPFAGDRITENAYRASHRQLAGNNQALRDKYKERKSYR